MSQAFFGSFQYPKTLKKNKFLSLSFQSDISVKEKGGINIFGNLKIVQNF